MTVIPCPHRVSQQNVNTAIRYRKQSIMYKVARCLSELWLVIGRSAHPFCLFFSDSFYGSRQSYLADVFQRPDLVV